MTETPTTHGGAHTCPRCTNPATADMLCGRCVWAFERALTDLAVMLPELGTTIARLDHVTRATSTRPRAVPELDAAAKAYWEQPAVHALEPHALPINLDAVALSVDAHAVLAATLAAVGRGAHPAAVAQMAARLHGLPDAPALIDALIAVTRQVETMIDGRRRPDLYVGPCDAPDIRSTFNEGVLVVEPAICGTDLYARLGERTTTCTTCGLVYDVAHRQQFLRDAVRGVTARPALIATALAAWDCDLTSARLDQWISRDKKRHTHCPTDTACGHIVAVDTDPDGKPRYLVGAVLERIDTLRAMRAAQDQQLEAAG